MTAISFRSTPAHTALIVVDVQNDFCAPDGALASTGEDVSPVMEMVPRLMRLIDAARSAGVPVIFVQTTHDDTNDTPAWLDRLDAQPGGQRTGIICRTGSGGADFYGVAPGPEDVVVIKHRYSAFVGTDLDIVLRSLGIRSLLFTGVATEVCVETSLRDGLSADYYVSLVADCAASYSPEAHANAVHAVERNFGTVTTGEELAAYWAGLRAPLG